MLRDRADGPSRGLLAARMRLYVSPGRDAYDGLLLAMGNSDTFLLDLVEELLALSDGQLVDEAASAHLHTLLETANSAYTTRTDGKGLAWRVEPGVQEAFEAAVGHGSQSSAGAHLTAAWNAAYGRSADPTKAYSEAVKAVEAALAPQVSPQNSRQTLGTMIRDVTAKPEKWEVTAPAGQSGIETVLAMMKSLWHGQTSRHGGPASTRPETIDEARSAVSLAAALVGFGSNGWFRPVA